MSGYDSVISKNWKPRFSALIDDYKARKDPHFFRPNGTQIYTGRQGSGKTVSALKHTLDLKKRYPKSVLVTNVHLNRDATGMRPIAFATQEQLERVCALLIENNKTHLYYVYFQSMEELSAALTTINNEKYGVIYLIDEIHTYFNSLESKNIPMYIFTEISQQRKQRKLIIGTSQIFERLAKPFREQCDNIISCKTKFGFFTMQTAYDGATIEKDLQGKTTGIIKKKGFFYHTRQLRSAFDTYQKVVSGQQQYEQSQQFVLDAKKLK